jgi:hypothetical protein
VELHVHATDPGQVAAITNTLPPGQHWDIVVLQGISHEATTTLGNPAQYVADAETILGNVRAHSPSATAVLFQTYARAVGHSWYPSVFANPMEMHTQVQVTNRNAVPTIEAMFGAGTVVNSAIGDCAALLEFDPAYYYVDLQHPSSRLTIISGMCLFTSIYSQLACSITPNIAPSSQLGAILLNYNLGLADWQQMAGIADRCADHNTRVYPGSGDLLLLQTGTQPGFLSACPIDVLTAGSTVDVRLSSPNGVFAGASGWLIANLIATGQPPARIAAFPELAIDLPSLAILQTTPSLASPLNWSLPMPFSYPGYSILVQGVAFGPSTETGNLLFTTTDAHELVFQ